MLGTGLDLCPLAVLRRPSNTECIDLRETEAERETAEAERETAEAERETAEAERETAEAER